MARKGNRKTRTGCITCKARKIKCDEAKPSCKRCTATGRRCDGYLPDGIVSARRPYAELRLHWPLQAFPGIGSAREGRALHYFCETAGPNLSGVVDPYFMSQLVMQFTTYESAARNSVVAISTLCEQLHTSDRGKLHLRDHAFALKHYNAAIRDVKAMTTQDSQPLVLLVCILFACIETLQSNRAAVITHCKHGFMLLKLATSEYAWTRQHLLPLFRRLAIMAFIHAEDEAEFPDLDGLEQAVPISFFTFADAQLVIEDIFSRTMRLVRRGDPYRISPKTNGTAPAELCGEQQQIKNELMRWKILFEEFEDRAPSSPGQEQKPGAENLTKTLRYILLSRYESCRVWLDTALGAEDYHYDDHFKALDAMFQDLGIRDPEFLASLRHSPTFVCDAGYLPTITLTSTRCAHLEARLKALNLIPVPGLPRENLCLPAHAWGCSALSARPQIIQPAD